MQIKGLTLENRQNMKSETKRLLSSLAVAAGTLGTALLIRKKVKGSADSEDKWARPGMLVTFRAELMPGHDGSERTFRIKTLLPSDRVMLDGISGEHAKTEFERVR
jgi:hypothetical protein